MNRVGWRRRKLQSAWTPPSVTSITCTVAPGGTRGARSRVSAATRRALSAIHGCSSASTPLAPSTMAVAAKSTSAATRRRPGNRSGIDGCPWRSQAATLSRRSAKGASAHRKTASG